MNAGRRGGLGPSNGAAAPRGMLLIAVAVVIGVLLLWKGLDPGPGPELVGPSEANEVTTTTAATEDTTPDGEPTDVTTPDGEPADTTTTTLFPQVTVAPNEVTVLVANGSGFSGAAGTTTDLLKPHGYVTLAPANAEPTDDSGIYYRSGMANEARAIQEILVPGDPTVLSLIPVTGLAVPASTVDRVDEADVVVILGADGLIYEG